MNAPAVSLTLEQTRLYARQVALPEVGVDGQARLTRAAVALVSSGDPAAAVAAEYLRAAGVGRVEVAPPASDGPGWLARLQGVQAAARFSLDDDALLRAAVRLAVPLVFGRAEGDRVDVLSFRRHGPCPHQALDLPTGPSTAALTAGAAAPLLAALVASELLWILIHPAAGPRARLLRLSLAGEAPQSAEIPWAPECFLCGGSGQEASFAGGPS